MSQVDLHVRVMGGYALMTVALTYPLVLHLNTHIPNFPLDPGVGDPWVYMWSFGLIHRIVMESAHWSLFTDMVFYPRGVDLTLPLVFGVGVPLFVSIPLVHFFGIILTYNFFIMGSFILNAYFTFLLGRYLCRDNSAAFISGVIFAFAPYHMVRALAHLNILASGMWIPLFILLFLKTMANGLTRYSILTSFTYSLIVISNLYYAFFLGLFVAFYILYNLRYQNILPTKKLFLKGLFSIGFITLLFFILIAYEIFIHGWQDFHVYIPRAMSYQFGADLLAFFLPSSFHSLWGDFVKPVYSNHFTGGISEQTVYLGYIVMTLAFLAIIKIPGKETRFWVLLALIFFVLALGAFIHIYGMPIGIPLPYLLFLFMPLVNTLRGASRSVIMVILALSILAGYGTKYLLKQLDEREGIRLSILGAIIMVIVFEFVTVPLPLVDARVPKVYQRIGVESRAGGTLIDLPLHSLITKYEYYQTTHGKRLLLGQASRMSVELLSTYADSVPLVRLFKNPELIHEYEKKAIDKREVLQLIEFFDLSFIVLHKDLLGADMFDMMGYFPRSSVRLQASEMVERLTRFFLIHFPVVHVETDGDIVSLELARTAGSTDELGVGGEYLIDFQAESSQGLLVEGWWPTEHDGETTFAWSKGKASELWVRIPQPEDYVMELRLNRIVSPRNPQQAVTLYINRQLQGEIPLEADGWQLYTVHIPKRNLKPGMNSLRFVYRNTSSPAEIYSSSKDERELAVAFDFIRLRPKSEGL